MAVDEGVDISFVLGIGRRVPARMNGPCAGFYPGLGNIIGVAGDARFSAAGSRSKSRPAIADILSQCDHHRAVAVPAVVLGGVFRLTNLRRAQDGGIAIFWQRDLTPLAEFVQAAC